MKKLFTSIALSTAICAIAAPLEFPGYATGIITTPTPTVAGQTSTLFQGRVEQGIVWFKFDENTWKFNTFANLTLTRDNSHLDYNNNTVPALGMKFTKSTSSTVTDIGVQAVRERSVTDLYHFSNDTTTRVQAFLSVTGVWDLKN